MKLGVVCEGHGDVIALPILLRRIADHLGRPRPEVLPPHRVPRSKLVKAGELERVVELIARKAGPASSIRVVVDADKDCPAELGPALLSRARKQRNDREIAVVLANREFEAWFVAAARSLCGQRGLPPSLEAPADPESITGAKEWLGRQMSAGYSETLDQPALAAVMDLHQASAAPSFAKLLKDAARLIRSGDS